MSKRRRPTKRAQRKHRFRMRMMAGMFDFLGTLLGFVMIIVTLTLLARLVMWLRQDINQSFGGIQDAISDAIVQPIDVDAGR